MTINALMPTPAFAMPANRAGLPVSCADRGIDSGIDFSVATWRRGIRVSAPVSALVAHVATQAAYVRDAKQAKGRPPRGMTC